MLFIQCNVNNVNEILFKIALQHSLPLLQFFKVKTTYTRTTQDYRFLIL